MTKFFYVFLLNLLVFSGRYHFDARLLDPRTLDKIRFEIEDSELNNIGTLREFYENKPHQAEAFRGRETESEESVVSRHFADDEGLKDPLFSTPFGNFRQHRCLGNSVERVEDNPPHEKGFYNIEKASSDWKDDRVRTLMKISNLREKKRVKRVPLKYLAAFGPEKPVRYLDYTNSQMPFNEGKLRHKSLKMKNVEVSEGTRKDEKTCLNYEHLFDPESDSKRLGRSMRRRLKIPLRSQEKNFEVPRDDPVLEYSRVRRFLDHERAIKGKRMSSTLEAKEAAMSRVLDPNLNLDGILEPHVRKRRDMTFSWMTKSGGKTEEGVLKIKEEKLQRDYHGGGCSKQENCNCK